MAVKAAWDTFHILLSGLLILCIKEHTDSEDITANCPETCLCYTPALSNGLLVNCSHRGLEQVPQMFPVNAVEIHLDHNSIETLGPLPCDAVLKLRKLYLNNNAISFVAKNVFELCNNGHLETLDLSHNNLSVFPDGLPASLTSLNLGFNVIEKLTGKHFRYLQQLQELSLRNNSILSLSGSTFHSKEGSTFLPDLRRLHLDNNKINLVEEKVFLKLSSLRHLSLAGNKLEVLKDKALQGLHMLQVLDLRANAISAIGSKSYKVLHSLQYLYLSHNNLTEIPRGLPMLEWLDLTHNNIVHVQEDISKNILYPIEVFLLSHNPLHCDCKMLWLKELFDTREYLLKFLDGVNSTDFYPTCMTPRELEGESWEVLGDEVFSCASEMGQDRVSNQNEANKNEEVKGHQEVNEVKRSAVLSDVTIRTVKTEEDGSVYIKWVCLGCIDIIGYELLYHPVGNRNNRVSIQVSPEVHDHSIKKLSPGAVYLICVVARVSWEDRVKVSLDQCTEVTTVDNHGWSTLLTWDLVYVILYTAVIASGVLLGLTVLSGVVIGASVWSLNRRDLGGSYGK